VTAARGLLDSSVLIAQETGRAIDSGALPDLFAVSVVTVAELTAGVLAAADAETAARRLATLGRIGAMTALPIDLEVAGQWARLRAVLAESGRRMGPNHLWIAATAVVHAVPVVTQDDDFLPLDGVAGVTVIHV
jgi:predicted nucleic acid-binding protein